MRESELRRRGVEIVERGIVFLQCQRCGQVWSPSFHPMGGRSVRGYWKCPNGCNEGMK